MAIRQAFAVAFGLAALILGGLYVTAYSNLVAQRQREYPAVPQPTAWLVVHNALSVFSVILLISVGTWVLIGTSSTMNCHSREEQ
jgi:drug/metabolite transporter (DMT)-like permease